MYLWTDWCPDTEYHNLFVRFSWSTWRPISSLTLVLYLESWYEFLLSAEAWTYMAEGRDFIEIGGKLSTRSRHTGTQRYTYSLYIKSVQRKGAKTNSSGKERKYTSMTWCVRWWHWKGSSRQWAVSSRQWATIPSDWRNESVCNETSNYGTVQQAHGEHRRACLQDAY